MKDWQTWPTVLLTRANVWEAWYFFEFFTKLTALARHLSISVKGKYRSRDETNVKHNLIRKKCNNSCRVSKVLTFHFAVVSYITLNHGTALLIRFWILLLFYQWTYLQQVCCVFSLFRANIFESTRTLAVEMCWPYLDVANLLQLFNDPEMIYTYIFLFWN